MPIGPASWKRKESKGLHRCPTNLHQMNPSPQAQRELQRVSVANPKGIASLSPGLRGTSYPGIEVSSIHNPEGVAAAPSIGHDHSADIQRALIDSVVEILNQGET